MGFLSRRTPARTSKPCKVRGYRRNPSLQWIDVHGQSIVVITPLPRPRRLHGAKHRVQPIARCITDQRIQNLLRSGQGESEGIVACRQRSDHARACFAARGGLFGCSIVLVRTFYHLARGKTGIGFQRYALWICPMQSREGHAGIEQARCAFEEHQPHGWIYQLERAMRSCRVIGRAMRVAFPCRPAFAIPVQRRTEIIPFQTAAVLDKLRPSVRPAEIVYGFARQTERKIEPRDPWTRALQPGFEMRPVGKFFEGVEMKSRMVAATAGYGNRFSNARAAGEVHAVDRPAGRFTHHCPSG